MDHLFLEGWLLGLRPRLAGRVAEPAVAAVARLEAAAPPVAGGGVVVGWAGPGVVGRRVLVAGAGDGDGWVVVLRVAAGAGQPGTADGPAPVSPATSVATASSRTRAPAAPAASTRRRRRPLRSTKTGSVINYFFPGWLGAGRLLGLPCGLRLCPDLPGALLVAGAPLVAGAVTPCAAQ